MAKNNLLPILLVLLLYSATCLAEDEEPTYAERLGWPFGSKVVIFHIDDTGMSHGSNRGTIQALEQGTTVSLSVMMPCPWVPEFAKYWREHPEIDAGLHLTLSSEWKNYRWGPVADKSAVAGLVDPEGYFWCSPRDTFKHATADEVETEIRAQIDKALAMGLKPTHLDSHIGVLFHPAYFNRYIKVGMEKRIPVLMFGGHMEHIGERLGKAQVLSRQLATQLWNAGLPVIDDLVTDPSESRDFEGKKTDLMELLRKMRPGITEIILHCTDPTESFAAFSSSGGRRYAELQLITDPELKKFIEDERIILTTWRELMQRREKIEENK